MKTDINKNERIFAVIAFYYCIFQIIQLLSIPVFGLNFYHIGSGGDWNEWQGVICGIVQLVIIFIMLFHIHRIWKS